MGGLQLKLKGSAAADGGRSSASDALSDPVAGGGALGDSLSGSALQLDGAAGAAPDAATAKGGLQGPGSPLPHLGKIQSSFGHHDVSGVKAFTGQSASEAAGGMGARAYTMNGSVGFSQGGADLHTAAHEAAHVVQQQSGIQLKGGVGEAGDTHERHADAVADKVVRGESAEGMLDSYAPGGVGSAGGLQLKPDGPGDGDKGDDTNPDGNKDDVTKKETNGGGGGGGGGNPNNNGTPNNPTNDGNTPNVTDIKPLDPEPVKDKTEPKDKPVDVKKGADLTANDGKGDPVVPSAEPVATMPGPTSTTVSVPGVGFGPLDPVLLGPGAEMVEMVTKMSLTAHLQANLAEHKQLQADAVSREKQFLSDAVGTAMVDLNMSLEEVRKHAASTKDVALQGLLSRYDDSTSSLNMTAEEATALLQASMERAKTSVQEACDAKSAEVKAAFDESVCRLEGQEVKWEGSVAKTVLAAAGQLRTLGAEYQKGASAQQEQAKKNATTAAGSRGQVPNNTKNAIVEAQEKAKASVYEQHAPLFVQYATYAALHLEKVAQSTHPFSESLHAPGIEQMFPISEEHQKQLEKEAETFDKTVSLETEQTIRALGKLTVDQTASLTDQKAKSEKTVTEAGANLEQRIQDAYEAVGLKGEVLTTRNKEALTQALQDIADLQSRVNGMPNSSKLQMSLFNLRARIESRLREAGTAIVDDLTKDKETIAAQANAKTDELDALIAAHNDQLVQATNTSNTVIIDAASAGSDNISTNIDQVNAAFTSVSKDTQGKSKGVTADAINESAEYQSLFVAQIQLYVSQAQSQFVNLRGKMDQAATAKASAAAEGEHENLQGRTKNIWKAIDRLGTDEAAILENLMGISPAEAGYIISYYPSLHQGWTIWEAITDDTSEGDNVRESAFAYLKGDPASGAMYAQLYATDRTSNWFGSNTDLIKKSMTSLTQEQRAEMLNDPDFPQLRALVEHQLKNDGLFGANSYDVDTYTHLTDANKTQKQALMAADAIELSQAFNGSWYNPFSYGTDEATTFKVLEKWQGEDLKAFTDTFNAYNGDTLKEEIESELGDLELDRGTALMNNDKVSADAARLQKALKDGSAADVHGTLEDKRFADKDNLADRSKAFQDREKLNQVWATKYGKDAKGNTKSLDEEVTKSVGGNKKKGAYSDEIALAHLQGKKVPPEMTLAHAILNGNDNSAEAVKAIQALRAELGSAPTPEAAKKRWDELQKWFATRHGITDLKKYLGVGENKYAYDTDDIRNPANMMMMTLSPGATLAYSWAADGEKRFDGQDAHDVDMAVMAFFAEDENVNDMYRKAHEQWNWYRSQGASGIGNFAADAYAGSGERLDQVHEEVSALYTDQSWYDAKTGKVKSDDVAKKKLQRFQEKCKLLDNVSDVYKDHRNELADAIVSAIMTITSIVATVFTGGLASVLVMAAGGVLSILVKSAIKGRAYSKKELEQDVQNIVKEAVKGLITMGMDKFAKMNKTLLKLAQDGEAGMKRAKVLLALAKESPKELFSFLTEPKNFEDPKTFFAGLTGASLKLFIGKTSEVYGGEKIADAVSGEGGKLLETIFNKFSEVTTETAVGGLDKFEFDYKVSNKELSQKYSGALVDSFKDRAVNHAKNANTARKLNKAVDTNKVSDEDLKTYKALEGTDKAAVEMYLKDNTQADLAWRIADPDAPEETQTKKDANADDAKTSTTPTVHENKLTDQQKQQANSTLAAQTAPPLAVLNTGDATKIAERFPELPADKLQLIVATVKSGKTFNSFKDVKNIDGVGDGTLKILRSKKK